MLKTDFRLSLKHLVIPVYLLVLISLLLLLARETSLEGPPFSLSGSAEVQVPPGSSLASINGKGFHPDMKGLFARTLINEEALLGQPLVGIQSYAVALNDGLLLVACSGGKVISIGLNENGNPSLLGSIQLPAKVTQMEIVGTRAIVGMHRHHGYALIDLEDPSDLKLLFRKDRSGLISDMKKAGDAVYFSDIYSGVGRIDLSNDDPVIEPLVALDSPWRLDHFEGKLAVGTLKGEVRLFDIDAKGSLREIKKLVFPTNVRGVAFTERSLSVALADGSLSVYDLSMWPDLNPVGQLNLYGSPLQLVRIPETERVAASLVAGGLAIIDVSQPDSPYFSGHHRVASTFRGLAATPDKIISANNKGLDIYSVDLIENGADAMLAMDALLAKGFYRLKGWNGQVVAFDGDTITALAGSPLSQTPDSRYLSFSNGEYIHLFEQKMDHSFQVVGAPFRVPELTASEYYQEHMYVLHRKGLLVLAGGRSEGLSPLGELALPGSPRRFAFLSPGRMIVATRTAGAQIIDISRPEQPRLLATVVPSQYLQAADVAYDVLVKGDLAFVSYGSGGVHVIDISQPENPELVQILKTPGLAMEMDFYDGLLLVSDRKAGLFVIDTDAEGGIFPVGSLQTPLRVDEMALVGEDLIVSSHPGGTMSLPLPERLTAVNVVREDEIRVHLEKVTSGQYVYLYDERNSGKVKIARP